MHALCGEQFHGRPAGGVRILLVAQVVGGLHGVIMTQTRMPPIVGRCGNQRVGLDAPVGDGPGLVQIQAVHTGERFHGFEILHERVVPCQTHGCDGEVERSEQYQAFGNHANDAGHRRDDRLTPCPGRDRVAKPADRMQLRPDQQDAQRHHHEGHDLQNRIDTAAQIGQIAFVDFRLRGEPRRIAVLPDRLHLGERHAGDRGGPGIDSIAFLLAHRP